MTDVEPGRSALDARVSSDLIGRRGLLAAAGVTGGVLAALGMSPSRAAAAPDEEGGGGVPVATIADLRALAEPAEELYLVTDPGQEGLFRAVSDDTDSADNTGTVIVTAGGTRYRRVYNGPLNVRWFGAKGDGETDDAAAIQATVDAVPQENWTDTAGNPNNPAVYLPAGIYAISQSIIFDPTVGGAHRLRGRLQHRNPHQGRHHLRRAVLRRLD